MNIDYIETERQPAMNRPLKVPLVERTKESLRSVCRLFNNTKIHISKKAKNKKKLTKKQKEVAKSEAKSAILGIGLLLVIVSIAYSSTVIYMLVDSNISRVALVPQVFFALYITHKAFSKLYK